MQDSGAGRAQKTQQDANIGGLLLATRPLRGFAASRLCFPCLSLTGPEKVARPVLTPASLKTQRRQDLKPRVSSSFPFASLREPIRVLRSPKKRTEGSRGKGKQPRTGTFFP
jgi:hypothetical protein